MIWDYTEHPGDCHPRTDDGVITVCCRECAGTGAFPVPWADTPERAIATDGGCVACKETGRAFVVFAAAP
ncbi:hypothetical protein SEA_DEXDERT_59 [Gordonia phage Dexdert]|uniref:Uncharacterized protein n=1 Tax=Gordonia phage Dexdert TaxID=2794946 RepID=A0A7T1NWG0_9CAUD|nr:hypothetical protein J1597_gp59 [Gordonia phage Dexdert]QPO17055.1 hypothetical protein SEA_DEXDERT_59 [Gordonia phage Dexdert]